MTIGLLVIGILASLSIPSPVVAGGVCIGFAGAAGLIYLARGDLRMRVKRLILRTILTAGIITGGTLCILGVMQVAQVGYLTLGLTGGLIAHSLLSSGYNKRRAQRLQHEYNWKYRDTKNATAPIKHDSKILEQ